MKLQNTIDTAYDVPNRESGYMLKTTKDGHMRKFPFKNYESLQEFYVEKIAEGWECEVIIR